MHNGAFYLDNSITEMNSFVLDLPLEQHDVAEPEHSPFYKMLMDMESEDKYGLITELLTPAAENMFVTPKEVDAVVDRLADIIARAVNMAMQPSLTEEDWKLFG